MGARAIRAVFLDAGNTLFVERRSRAAVYASVLRKFGCRAGEVQALASMTAQAASLPQSLDGCFRYSLAWFRMFNERVCADLGVAAERRDAAHLELTRRFEDPKTYRVFGEVREVLDELLNRGLVVGVVSNWSERLPALCQGLGLADKVSFIVTSADVRSEKPERAIFERALFRAGVPAEDTLHVGDHLHRDVRGALNAGLRAALLDRKGGPGSSVDGIPVLSDLRGVLGLCAVPNHALRA
ncbi:MAG: HAD family hydrolase [Planctomycetota bacterium]|nr:MAG: HAD family hydrolase [Planctomycetota bacterium]